MWWSLVGSLAETGLDHQLIHSLSLPATSHYQATYVNIVTHNCSSQLAAGEEETKFSAALVTAPTSIVYTGLLVVPTR